MISNIVSMTDTDFINMDGYSYVVKSFSLQYQKGLRIIKDYYAFNKLPDVVPVKEYCKEIEKCIKCLKSKHKRTIKPNPQEILPNIEFNNNSINEQIAICDDVPKYPTEDSPHLHNRNVSIQENPSISASQVNTNQSTISIQENPTTSNSQVYTHQETEVEDPPSMISVQEDSLCYESTSCSENTHRKRRSCMKVIDFASMLGKSPIKKAKVNEDDIFNIPSQKDIKEDIKRQNKKSIVMKMNRKNKSRKK